MRFRCVYTLRPRECETWARCGYTYIRASTAKWEIAVSARTICRHRVGQCVYICLSVGRESARCAYIPIYGRRVGSVCIYLYTGVDSLVGNSGIGQDDM